MADGSVDQVRHGAVRTLHLGEGLPSIPEMMGELQDMTDVLLKRRKAPINHGVLTLMVLSDAYFARASELTMLIQQSEREGTVTKGSAYYRFRTGELRTFMEMCKRSEELGSRLLTFEQVLWEQEKYGRESKGAI